jgi:hypothetical protein
MKGLLTVVALVLLLVWVPSGNLVSLDTPFPQEGGSGGGGPDDGGDDHPFGGENNIDGPDIPDRERRTVAFGIPALDLIFTFSYIKAWFVDYVYVQDQNESVVSSDRRTTTHDGGARK